MPIDFSFEHIVVACFWHFTWYPGPVPYRFWKLGHYLQFTEFLQVFLQLIYTLAVPTPSPVLHRFKRLDRPHSPQLLCTLPLTFTGPRGPRKSQHVPLLLSRGGPDHVPPPGEGAGLLETLIKQGRLTAAGKHLRKEIMSLKRRKYLQNLYPWPLKTSENGQSFPTLGKNHSHHRHCSGHRLLWAHPATGSGRDGHLVQTPRQTAEAWGCVCVPTHSHPCGRLPLPPTRFSGDKCIRLCQWHFFWGKLGVTVGHGSRQTHRTISAPLHTPLTIHCKLLACGEDLFPLPFSSSQLRWWGRGVLRGRMSPTWGGFFPILYLTLSQLLLTLQVGPFLGGSHPGKRTLGSTSAQQHPPPFPVLHLPGLLAPGLSPQLPPFFTGAVCKTTI